MRGSWRVGRIAGIEVGIHYTWLLALFIFTWLLGQGFSTTYPGWYTYFYWIAGFLATFTLFLSVLIHELAHSLVARSRGLAVSSITLFILGGVSNLAQEPENPGVEFYMAIVGPLTSLALGFIFWVIWYFITKTWVLPVFSVNIPANKQSLGLAITGFLAYTNIALAIFNLLPGFPLDGGRVFRSILWRATGNLYRATNIASVIGRVFGWGFIALGVVLAIFTQFGFLNGLWFVFLGWFLNSAADNSSLEVTLKEHLSGVPVEQIMEKDIESVRPDTTIDYLVQTIFVQKRKRAVPVAEGDNLVGVVTISDIKALPQERWTLTPVLQVMHREPIHTVKPEDDLNTAMKLMAQYDLNQIPVLNQGKLVGMLTRADVINYLQLSQELHIKGKHKTNSPGAAAKS
ncbi:MAG: site-2 protease family protein [Dehalococcoidales bacterium]|jgi:Zn-dependent protease